MKVRARQKTYYAGRERLPGDEFEMDDRQHVDIKILTVLGTIEPVEQEEARPAAAPTYRAAAMVPEPKAEEPKPAAQVVTTEAAEPLSPERRVYRRRDMRAER